MITKETVVPTPLQAYRQTDLPSVLGRTEAKLERGLLRWLRKTCGYLDVHTRQKWTLLRPLLGGLPERGVRLLDAGCGSGRWALELGAQRPDWTVVGVDLDPGAIQEARSRQQRLNLSNVSFELASFLEYQPDEQFDVILSIASAHYLAQGGQAPALFTRFADWVSPGGTLLLYGPRDPQSIPANRWLPRLSNDWGYSRRYLLDLCRDAGFAVEADGSYGLYPVIGRWSTLAKQIAIATDPYLPVRAVAYPLALALGSLDLGGFAGNEPSAAWLLVARKENR